MELAPGTLLQAGKYKIIEKLGQGGFGIAYGAYHQNLKRDVCIKEFFYSDLCERSQNSLDVTIITKSAEKLSQVNSFKKKFTKEAQRLAKFQHPNIVQVTDTFEENNTAYFVMEYLQGGSLEDLLSRKGVLSEQKTKEIILPLVDALDTIHKTDLLHLDIKPANIMLRNNQTPVLIDFGISKYIELAGGVTTTAPVGISKGYAPLEQYGGNISHFSKATDIYSLCATMYKMVTGQAPLEPLQMVTSGLKSPRDINPEISIHFNETIIKGLSLKTTDRHQSMSKLRLAMGESKKDQKTSDLTVVEISEPVLQTAVAYFKRAENKRINKQYKDAVKDYTEAIKKNSKIDDYFFYRAMCYSELGIQREAIGDYSTAIKLNSNNGAAFNNRGVCYEELNRSEDAINDFYEAFELDQDDLYFNNWINIVKSSNVTTTLDKYLNHAWPNKDKVYFKRGKILFENGKLTEGREDIIKSKELGNTEANEWLKSNSWKSSEILNPVIVLVVSNIIAVISTFFVFSNDISLSDSEKWHWTLIPMIISIFFSYYKSYPHIEASAKLHVYTEPSFQQVEKLIYSFINIYLLLLISYLLYYYIYIEEGGVVLTTFISVFVVFPIYSLYLIWSKSKKRNIQYINTYD